MASRLIVGTLALHPPTGHALNAHQRMDHVELAQPPRGRVEYVPANASAPLHACREMPQSFAPTVELIRRHSQAGAVVATFTNPGAAKFALNWARQLRSVGLKSIVGLSKRLAVETEDELRAAGAGLFCADGEHMQLNGQAGRWSEVWPLLRAGVHVLLSDSDIAWMRNPLPYFEQVRLRHPRLDYLLCTDTAYNNYAAAPLHRRNRRRRLQAEKEALVERQKSSLLQLDEAGDPLEMSSLLQLDEGRGSTQGVRGGASLMAEGAEGAEDGVDAAIAAARLDEPGEEDWAPPHGIGGLGLARGGGAGGAGGSGGAGDARRLAEEGGGVGSASGAGAARSAAAGTWDDLELENAYDNKISYNIGVLFMYSHAAEQLEGLMGAWARAVVQEPGQGPQQQGGGKQRGKQNGRSPPPRSSWWGGAPGKAGAPALAAWDQDPINKLVIQRGMVVDPLDRQLVRTFERTLSLGILPMLQFTTAFTYFIHRERRESLGVPPYSLHAIFAHGKEAARKQFIFREEQLWHDPPSYYEGRFLEFETSWPPRLKQEGGFELIAVQLRQFEVAVKLASLLDRTLVLPRLRCGERTMAYPCYAWYHRAMAYFGLNFAKVPMPEVCPLYYWFSAQQAEQKGLKFREPNFLTNPRVPQHISASVATARVCHPRAATHSTGSCGGAGRRAAADAVSPQATEATEARRPELTLFANTTRRQLLRTLRGVEARVLRVQHVGLLASALADDLDQRARKELRELSGNAWCTGCPITRKGALVTDLNRSAAHDVEHFCRAEARGLLGLRPTMTCCSPSSAGCHTCHPGERKTKTNATLSWSVRRWLPVWAGLSYPPEYPPPERPWECRHPLCTGENRARFP